MTHGYRKKRIQISATIVSLIFWLLFQVPELCLGQDFAEEAYEKGLKWAMQGKFRDAKKEFLQGLDIEPNYAPFSQGLKIVEDVLSSKIKAETAVHLFRSADCANQGLLDESIAEDEIAVRLDPDYAPGYSSLGASYIEKSMFDKAISFLDKAIEIDPLHYESYVMRGLALAYQKKYIEAISDYSKAIDINPKDAGIYYNRALACFQRGDCLNAAKDANHAKSMGFPVPQEFIDSIRQKLNSQL
jgi:tetratricopeptide (TPR) repeat protein